MSGEFARRTGRRPWAAGAVGTAVIVVLAEAASRSLLVEPQVLPPVSAVLLRAVRLAGDPGFVRAAGITVGWWAAGTAIAVLVAVPAGLVLGTVPRLETITRPLLELLRPLPPVALIPLVLLILGDDARMTVAVIAFAACWPVLIHTMHGLHQAQPLAKDTLRAFGFGPGAVTCRVALPSAAPFIATGVRIASAVALAVAVSAELFAGGGQGIGTWLVSVSGGTDQIPVTLAAVVWVGVISMIADAVLRWGQGRLFGWHRAAPGSSSGGSGAEGSRPRAADWAARVLLLSALAAVWEVGTRAAADPYFPPPTRIAERMRQLWFGGPPAHAWLSDIAIADLPPSLARLLSAWLLGSAAGVALGLALGRLPLLGDALEPVLHFLRAIPPVTLVPVWLAVMPIGAPMQVTTIAFGVIWPMTLAAADGARGIDPVQIDTARVFGLSGSERLTRLIIPAALPKIFAGLHLTLSLALILMVVSELMGGATNGVAYRLLLESERTWDLPAMWVGLCVLGVLGLIVNSALRAVQNHALASHGPAAT